MDFWVIDGVHRIRNSSKQTILYHAMPNRKWYVSAWKIISGVVIVVILTLIVNSLLASLTDSALNSFLPAQFAGLLTKLLYLGIIPLGAASWVIEDIASTYFGEFILTDQRIWIRGSPYAWSQSDIPLEDISSLTWRRDAVFIRQKSTRKIQVLIFPEGKLFVQAYKNYRKQVINGSDILKQVKYVPKLKEDGTFILPLCSYCSFASCHNASISSMDISESFLPCFFAPCST